MLRGIFERSLGHFTPFNLLFRILRIQVFIIVIITFAIAILTKFFYFYTTNISPFSCKSKTF